MGSKRLRWLLKRFGTSSQIWQAQPNALKATNLPDRLIQNILEARKQLDPLKYHQQLTSSGIKFYLAGESDYPEALASLADPPLIIYYRGQILAKDKLAIAVVGSRKMTSYGKLVTQQLVTNLAKNGVTIISGLARGVDTVAHQSCLNNGGRTIAVLGGGLNQLYPPENQALAAKIWSGNGAVISQFPPDYSSTPGNFPARNQLIAGLAKAVLVTEADLASGSLITAREALDQGKEVLAVPGPISSQLSQGPHLLIKNGAKLVDRVEDILDELNLEAKSLPSISLSELSSLEQSIIKALSEPKQIDELSRELKRPVSELSACLIKLEIAGLIEMVGQGEYIKCLAIS